jgi:predicted nucleotidyltransferase
VDLLLHPAENRGHDRPDPRGRLSTVGHGRAFRAFARAAKRAGLRFMVIGGTFRDVAIRPASTRDIDVVLIDHKDVDPEIMEAAGFTPVPRSQHAWRYRAGARTVDLEIAAVASSSEPSGPFSIAFAQAETATIEGTRVTVPRVEDYVILKLLAASSDRRRHARDLADVQYTLEAFPARARTTLSVAAVRARLRDLYALRGQRLKDLVALFRQVPRPRAR